jgi:predicted murein hydrolase (TIGR00659 family)
MMYRFPTEFALHALFWSIATIGLYRAAKRLHRKWPRFWLMPLVVTPALLAALVLALHANYRDYIGGTQWLVLLLGPATVAFAVPIYEQRALIRRQWPVLLAGMVAGSIASVLSSWALATLVGLDASLRLSLLPRSITMPFAREMSGGIGGSPDLTAIFVVVTGISGALIGDMMLARIPFRSALARGALFGVGAHGVGTAQAYRIGQTEGAVAGLVMVLVGLLNVLAAPLIVHLMR